MRLAEIRKAAEISQKDLAEQIGYSQNMISQWENGSRDPNTEVLKKLANFFNVTIDFLLGYVPINQLSDKFSENSDLSNFEIDIIQKIKLLNNKGRDKLYMYLDDLLENPSNISNNDTVKNEDVS